MLIAEVFERIVTTTLTAAFFAFIIPPLYTVLFVVTRFLAPPCQLHHSLTKRKTANLASGLFLSHCRKLASKSFLEHKKVDHQKTTIFLDLSV